MVTWKSNIQYSNKLTKSENMFLDGCEVQWEHDNVPHLKFHKDRTK